jgi:hypothetical protein
MTTLNRHEFPPHGWQFTQPQTRWNNPAAMIGFDASVDAIVAHRRANAAISSRYKLSTDPVVVEDELLAYTSKRTGAKVEGDSPPKRVLLRPSARVVGAAAGGGNVTFAQRVSGAASNLKRAAQGTAVILDWLTSGGTPVAQELAEKRAAICAACPKNLPGSWYTVAPAEIIRETLESRKDLKLETSKDAELKSCDVCRCLMVLKIWTPLDYIVKNTVPEIMAEFPAGCWIAKRDQ